MTFAEIAELERRYLIPVYNRYSLAIARGKGVFVYDLEGRRYLDFITGIGVNALGHAHPRIVKVIREQAARAIHLSNLYYNEYQGALAKKLSELSGLQRVFFSNSGTEAIEGALKVARAAGHQRGGEAKSKVVAVEGSFHGRTFGALSVTGQQKYRDLFQPLLAGVTFVPLNDVAALRQAVDDSTCALVLEPIQGEGGIRECSAEFLGEARAACDRHRAVLIFDEIQCGLGRTGKMFAFQDGGVTPDIVVVAKPIAAGLPLGAFIAREELSAALPSGQHGTTFGGGPLACRVALEYFAILEEEHLLENAARVGAYFNEQLKSVAGKSSLVRQVRGRGLMQAMELTIPARPLVDQALSEGVLFNSTHETVLRFLPSFLIEEKHVDKGIRVVGKLLREAKKAAKSAAAN